MYKGIGCLTTVNSGWGVSKEETDHINDLDPVRVVRKSKWVRVGVRSVYVSKRPLHMKP